MINEYINNFLEYGYKPLFSKVTRPNSADGTTGSCIDNMFLKADINNNNILKTKSLILKQVFPNHYPLITCLKVDTATKYTDSTFYIDYKVLDSPCQKVDWLKYINMRDPEMISNDLIVVIQDAISKATKKVKKKN